MVSTHNRDKPWDTPDAVSYTHLDVYKRQDEDTVEFLKPFLIDWSL